MEEINMKLYILQTLVLILNRELQGDINCNECKYMRITPKSLVASCDFVSEGTPGEITEGKVTVGKCQYFRRDWVKL